MSIADLKRSKIESIRRSCNCSFSDNLKAAFELNAERKPAEPIWLKLKKVEILEPIIKTNNRIKPIMTKVIAADTNDITVVRKEDHAEESSYDLSALLNALNMFTVSSSQIQMQDLASALEELVQLPLPQLARAIESIDFVSWSADITAELFKVVEKAENIPNTNAALLVHAAVYAKITKLTSSASRTLMNSIIQLAKLEGKAVIEGVLIPLIFQSDLAKPQSEIITKTITEALNPTQRVFLLQVILSDGEMYYVNSQNLLKSNDRKYLRPWNDNVFQILNTILSAQPLISLTKTSIIDLVQPIKAIVQANPKDKGSMQLLLLLTSKYPQALVEFKALELIEEICHTSTMFLKRAVLSQITSIKKKIVA